MAIFPPWVWIALTTLGLGIITLDSMGLFRRKNQFPVEGRTAVVTGGSQGMGKSVAKLLARKGANVVIVAQDVGKLEVAVKDISTAALSPQKQRFSHISADLRKPEETDRIIREVSAWNNNTPPDIVWCCAGHCLPGYFIDSPMETLRGQMDTVYWSAANMAHSILRSWFKAANSANDSSAPSKTSPARHLVFTSSVAAFYPFTGYSPYAPAKAAMRALSDSLVQEIELYNGTRRHQGAASPATDVKVHTVFPCGIRSPGFENEEKMKPTLTKKLEESDKPQDPDAVAAEAVKGLEAGEYMITTMFLGSLMKWTSLGGSPRNSVVIDTVMSWLSGLIMNFVQKDFRDKAWAWGKQHGLPQGTQQ